MHLKSLAVHQFRNLQTTQLSLAPGFNLFHGANAQGKSNLLEAIHTLAFLKGFRAKQSLELVAFGCEEAQLSASLEREDAEMDLALALRARTRKAQVDGQVVTRVMDYLGLLRLVLFVPSDVSLLQATPAERRTFLDRMVFGQRPSLLLELEKYQKCCKMKAAELKQPLPDLNLLAAYDEQRLAFAKRIVSARHLYLQRLAPYVGKAFERIFGESIDCQLLYHCNTWPEALCYGGSEQKNVAEADLHAAIDEAFARAAKREVQQRLLLSGPQRDDWGLALSRREAKLFSSQGQQRALILSMKMAEIEYLRASTGLAPIFLLDDVSSELDAKRNARLLEALMELRGQIFLSTTSRAHFPKLDGAQCYRVEAGRIESEV